MLRNLIKSNQKFIKHNLFSYGVIIFNIISSIYSIKEILLVLDKELYGLWIVASSFVGLLGIFNFGFNTIAIFKFTEYQKQNKLSIFFSGNLYVLIFQLFLTGIGFLLLFIFSPVIVKNAINNVLFKQLLFLIIPGTIFNIISFYFEAILYYNLKFIYQKNILEFIRIGLINILFVIGLYIWSDVRCLGYIYSIVSAFVLGYTLIKFIKNQKINIEPSEVNPYYLKTNFKNAFSFWILNFSTYIISQTDVLFISTFKKDLGLVTVYSQSFRLQEIASRFIRKITEIKGPKILSLYNDGNKLAVIDIYKKLILINLALSISSFFAIFFLGKPILEYWLNKQIIFDQTLISVLSLLCITGSLHWVFWNFCGITEQQNKVKTISIIEVFLNLGLSYFLIKNIGIIGLGIASLISNSITIIYMYALFEKYQTNK